MDKPKEKPKSLCMVPWTHTYVSPVSERRLCCASREPASAFQQYIDKEGDTGEYQPLSLWAHWNSDYMKEIRRKMMNGEEVSACEVCNHKLLNTNVYKDYFWHLFKHKYDEIWTNTTDTGATVMSPVSWDYRFSNLCNFKCRMCGDVLSSSWETENKKYDDIDWENPQNKWMDPTVRANISKFQSIVIENEFAFEVENGNVEEIYWVGGEPLMFEQHWKYMNRIIELGNGGQVYARYNTNLSRTSYKGTNLFTDILPNIRDWEICASIDGTGFVGEYIRTGLVYDTFIKNFKEGMKVQNRPNQMRLDFTLTLPGLYEVKNMFDLSKELNCDILSKVCFAFSPDIAMSPLCLPRTILNPFIDELLDYCEPIATWKQQSLIDVLKNLKNRPNFEEQWPETFQNGIVEGKKYLEKIESRRPEGGKITCILQGDVLEWWNSIKT
jgi:hypothetical protein